MWEKPLSLRTRGSGEGLSPFSCLREQNADARINTICKSISEMMLVSIEKKKIYQHAEFQEAQATHTTLVRPWWGKGQGQGQQGWRTEVGNGWPDAQVSSGVAKGAGLGDQGCASDGMVQGGQGQGQGGLQRQ